MKVFISALNFYSGNLMSVVIQRAQQFDKGTGGNVMLGRRQQTDIETPMTHLPQWSTEPNVLTATCWWWMLGEETNKHVVY